MSNRSITLNLIKKAGYDNDQQAFVRLYCENRISYLVAKEYFNRGREIKLKKLEGIEIC